MKYKYFKFANPLGSDNVYIARVIPGNCIYEYKAIKRPKDKFFHWDDDWLEHDVTSSDLSDNNAYEMILSASKHFKKMTEKEVFMALL